MNHYGIGSYGSVPYSGTAWVSPSSGNSYDETGRGITVLAQLGQTNVQAMLESGRAETIRAVLGETDAQGMSETGRLLSIVLAQIGKTDVAAFIETGRGITLLALTGRADTQQMVETGKSVLILALTGETDYRSFFESGKLLALILAQVFGTSTWTGIENVGEIAKAQIGRTDVAAWLEINKTIIIKAVLGETDSLNIGSFVLVTGKRLRAFLRSGRLAGLFTGKRLEH